MRPTQVRPVALAVAPVTATTPGHPGQLALWLGGFHVRATLEKRRSRRREPGFRPLGTAAHQGKALEVEVYLP